MKGEEKSAITPRVKFHRSGAKAAATLFGGDHRASALSPGDAEIPASVNDISIAGIGLVTDHPLEPGISLD